MERATLTQCENAARHLNDSLAARLSTARVVIQSRNGYVGLDLYDDDGRCLRTLTAGTRREILEALRAMRWTLDCLDTPFVENAVRASA